MKNIFIMLFGLLAGNASSATLHDFSFESINGGKINLSDFKGKVVLVVNTASHCGFTSQYEELEQLYSIYKERGLEIVSVPSSDFGEQEYKKNEDVQRFLEDTYQISFPVAEISHVKGDEAHLFYKWAGKEVGLLSKPKWNFHKYLFSKDGKLVDSFSSITSPMSKKIISAIGKLLDEPL